MRYFFATLIVAVLLAAMMAFVQGVRARELYKGQYDNVRPDIKKWYETRHNKAGGSCCANGDGHPFYGDYVLKKDGSVEFDADGVHHVLPAYMVLDGPNPTGHAVWWWVEWSPGEKTSYCFAPGAGG